MRSNHVRRLVLALCVPALVALGSCATSKINKGDFSIISVQEEWEFGEQLSADIAKEMAVIDDPGVNAYITLMGEAILAQAQGDSEVAGLPWHFHVIADDQVNAFNIPGGHVYFFSGLIARADTWSEVMGVMGHEVSHGLARHGVENLTKQYGISMVASLILGQNPEAYQALLANIVTGGTVMKFSRDAEREADDLGIHYMFSAGVDPQGLMDFFQVLLELRGQKPGMIEQFFSSHPLTEERIESVRHAVAELPSDNLKRDDDGFAGFKRSVMAAAGSR